MRVDLMGSMPISRPLRPVRRDSGAAMSDLLGHVGRPLPALPPAGRRDDQADGDRDRPVEYRGGVAERAFDEWVLQDHLARNIAEKAPAQPDDPRVDRKSTRLNSSHLVISYAVFCLKKKNKHGLTTTLT